MQRFTFILALALCGCSYIKPIGKIGNTEFYKVQATSFLGPTVVTIVTKPCDNTNGATLQGSYAGNGFIPAAVGAGAIVGGALILGDAIRHNSDRGNSIIQTISAEAAGGTGGAGGAGGAGGTSSVNAVATATSSPVISSPVMSKPGKPNRPPDNRPPYK